MVGPIKYLGKMMQGVGWKTTDLFLGIIFGLLLTPYMVDVLGFNLYGFWVIVASLTGWYALLDMGLTQAVSRHVTLYFARSETDEISGIASTACLIYFSLGVLALVIVALIALAFQIFKADMPDVNILCVAILISGVTFVISMLQRVFRGVVWGVMRQDLAGRCLVGFRILGVLTTFLLLYFGGGLLAVLIGSLLVMMIQTAVEFMLAIHSCPGFQLRRRHVKKRHAKELFDYSVWTFIGQIGNLVITRSDILIITTMIGIAEVTNYNLVVVLLFGYFVSLLLALNSWQNTWFAYAQAENNQKLIESSLQLFRKLAIYLTAFMCFGSIFWCPAFITTWVGEEHLLAYPALIVIMGVQWIGRGHASTNVRFLQGVARHRIYAWCLIAQAVVNLILSIVLVKMGWGLLGVAIGTALPEFITHNIVLPIYMCRIRSKSLASYYWRFLESHARACLCLIVPGVLTYLFIAPEYPRMVLVGALSALAYGLGVYVIGVNRNERESGIAMLKRGMRPGSGNTTAA